MPTVAQATLAAAECLLLPRYGTATDSIIIPTQFRDDAMEEPDDYFAGGTVWLFSPPHTGMVRSVISQIGNLVTLSSAVETLIQEGERYAMLDGRYPLNELIGALNKALQEIGPFTQKDDTLTIGDKQVRYTLPAGVANVKRVQFATQETEPYGWTAPHHWWQEHGGEIILDDYHLPSPAITGNKIRIWYEGPHPRVWAETDVVTGDVDLQRIAWHTAWIAARNRNARPETSDNLTKATEEQCMRQALGLQQKHQVRRMDKDQTWPSYV